MLGSHVSHERQVELFRCGHNAAAVGSLMSYDRIGEVIDAQIEIALVRVTFFGRGSVDQRQTDRIVGGLVPAVFAVVEHRDAVRTVGVGQVGPLQGGHFVCRGRVVAALDKTDAEVVSGFRIAHRHRELGFEQRIAAVPVHRRTDVDAVVLRTVGQRNVLRELRIAVRALHLERSAHGPLFADGYRNVVGNGARGSCPRPPSAPPMRAIRSTDCLRKSPDGRPCPARPVHGRNACPRATRCRRSCRASPCKRRSRSYCRSRSAPTIWRAMPDGRRRRHTPPTSRRRRMRSRPCRPRG